MTRTKPTFEPGEETKKKTRPTTAVQTVEEQEEWKLVGRGREAFVNALLNPRPPSARIKGAAKRYRNRVTRA